MAEENIYIKNHVTVQAYRGKTLDIKLNKFDQMHFITEKNDAARQEYKNWLEFEENKNNEKASDETDFVKPNNP